MLDLLVLVATMSVTPNSPPVDRAYETGKVLIGRCQGPTIDQDRCLNYIAGVTDFMSLGGDHPPMVCVPVGVVATRLRDVVVAYAFDHPDKLRSSAAILVGGALYAAYPCAN